MTPDRLEHLHAAVYRHTGANPMWLGYWLKQFIESEELRWSDLAKELGISNDKLILLCLCKTPRADHFQEDLRVVCERTGAREETVARIVRQEQAMTRWRGKTATSSKGWLLAASDHDQSAESGKGAEGDNDED